MIHELEPGETMEADNGYIGECPNIASARLVKHDVIIEKN